MSESYDPLPATKLAEGRTIICPSCSGSGHLCPHESVEHDCDEWWGCEVCAAIGSVRLEQVGWQDPAGLLRDMSSPGVVGARLVGGPPWLPVFLLVTVDV